MVLVCDRCNRETSHAILAEVKSHDSDPEGDIQVWDDYSVVQCRGCRSLSFCHSSRCTEDCDPHDVNALLNRIKQYPSRVAGRPPLRDAYHLPNSVGQIYEETRAALVQEHPILAGIGIRAIVETICNEKTAPGRDLREKITGLVTLHLITPSEAEVLHRLRFMGNQAAHSVKAHGSDELNTALDVVEHLLRTVYLLQIQTKRLPTPRTRVAAASISGDVDLE